MRRNEELKRLQDDASPRSPPAPRFARRDALAAALALALGCSEPIAKGRNIVPLWFTYGGKNREVLELLIARFNQRQKRDYVHGVFQGDYFEGLAKLRTALAAGAAPALSHVVGEVVPYLAEAGVLQTLPENSDIVPALGQAGSFTQGGQKPFVTLPFNRSTPIAYLNAELFRRAGLQAPSTWSELAHAAGVLTVRKGAEIERFGFACPIDWWFWAALVGQAGGDVIEADGRVTLGGEAGVQALEFWRTLVLRERTMKPPPGRDYNAWQQTNQDFLAGRVAMIWTSTAFLRYLEENARFAVQAAPLPALVRRAVPTGGTHWVVLKDAPEAAKQGAFRFLSFMLEPAQVIDWSTRTGYLPVTQAAIAKLETSGYYAKHPNDRVALSQLPDARPWPWSTELFRVQREIVQPKLELSVLTDRPAREVLDEARALLQRSAG
ncbi:MAG TPA: ABC transporter substrate-binding protein [Polyangiaceae bacterium]|nr:ABC transporter substrate-binding protein [Polyangiaceae bacterium]